jgi:site-specific DNA-methyltransferase (adenine-specific)
MTTRHTIITGDSRRMTELRDESVHLVVTSPPYWQLKDYGNNRQIGFHDSYEHYINNLNLVWKECCRVLHKGCRLCINIGDQFARSVYYGRYKVIPIRTEITKFCECVGMDYMGGIIWQKVTTTNTTGGATIMGSFPYPRNGILKIDYEFILVFKKPGDPPPVSKKCKELSKLTTAEWNSYFAGHWNFPGEKQEKHLAMFPEELPRRLIHMFSFVGETVLDPFLGSGTTSLAARKLGRNSIGYELHPSFVPIIKKKLQSLPRNASPDATIDFITRRRPNNDFSRDIASLPYTFTDPHRLDKKVDPRKLKFGSRITKRDSGKRFETFQVTEVMSPELLKLSNGTVIRLLGVKEDPARRRNAVAFLISKTKGQRVFVRSENGKQDNNGNVFSYVYLRNRTFLNAHLLKSRLVRVDDSVDHKFRKKFLSLFNGASV